MADAQQANPEQNESQEQPAEPSLEQDFPTDMTEYYYRCNISAIEQGSEDFYAAVNTLGENRETLKQFGFEQISAKVAKYNKDFHCVSEKLINKTDINSCEEYDMQFNLLRRISNEMLLLISEWYRSVYYTKKKRKLLRKTRLIPSDKTTWSEWKTNPPNNAQRNDPATENDKRKSISIQTLVFDFANVSNNLFPNPVVDRAAYLLISTMLYIFAIIVVSGLAAAGIVFLIPLYNKSGNLAKLLLIAGAVVAVIVLLMALIRLSSVLFDSPATLQLQRRTRVYRQSKPIMIEPNMKYNQKRREKIIPSLREITELIKAVQGNGDSE